MAASFTWWHWYRHWSTWQKALFSLRLYAYIFPENVTRELVMRVIGLGKTLPAKGALGFQKCGQHGVGGIPTKWKHGKKVCRTKTWSQVLTESQTDLLFFFLNPSKGKSEKKRFDWLLFFIILPFYSFLYFWLPTVTREIAKVSDEVVPLEF